MRRTIIVLDVEDDVPSGKALAERLAKVFRAFPLGVRDAAVYETVEALIKDAVARKDIFQNEAEPLPLVAEA